ncbi:toll/interleukin-1 receptor domain-containing protein [Stenomitos frigidus]|uniref:TIR domain-containing protein n=1 Tax=Stenomitos frigidus ULC18 TaxID=2107698 RepID=A0A2T1E9P9_9CYAN|nr:toll/interleukin-1 receptor domain-containing protein [Stenomitos frigidus]PSB29433.1 hypothetical protein C7B82_11470 [Stenomitos frigidus ULC18]
MNASTIQTAKQLQTAILHEAGSDVFISYSRKDQSFVRTLSAAFKQLNHDPWVDWEDIQKGEEWWKAIQRGIENAHTFVFIMSPDSVKSSVCREEIEYAAACNKRFLPIVYREGFDQKQVHFKLSSHNWLFFREADDFNEAFQELMKAIDTDLEYVRMHTRLLVRALEWQGKAKNPSSLLRGLDLEEAQQWLIKRMGKEPLPTNAHVQYIKASRDTEVARVSARRKARRTVLLTTLLANIVLSVAGGSWFYQFRLNEALERIQKEMVQALQAGRFGTNGDHFAALADLYVPKGSTPIDNPLYQEHQKWLTDLHTVFPNAIPRTYKVGSPGKIMWIGDLSRSIAIGRETTDFLEPFKAEHSERKVFDDKITVIMTPYEDELGHWISASGPIKNSAGQIVGGIRVDFTEAYLIQVQAETQKTLLVAYLLVAVWLFILSWIILRSLRPIEED